MSTMNLLPDYYVKKRYRSRVDMVCVVLFAIIMMVIIGAEFLSNSQSVKFQSEYAEVNKEFTGTANFLKNNFFQLQGQKQAMLKEAKATAEKEDRVPRSYVLAVVTNACPENVSLSEIILKTTDPNKQTGKKIVKRVKSGAKAEKEKPKLPLVIEVNVRGEAQNDSDFITLFSALKSHPLIKKIEQEYTREEGSDSRGTRRSSSGNNGTEKEMEPLREFAFHMELHNGIDVNEIIHKTKRTKPLNTKKKITQEGGPK